MRKNGVFVCKCGVNIAGTVDVEKVAEEIAQQQTVEHCEVYDYMCSDPGQKMIEDAVKEKGLNGIVVACCSPTLHEETFRNVTESAGLNKFSCEIANIREQCSWVHKDRDKATEKARRIIKGVIEKVNMNEGEYNNLPFLVIYTDGAFSPPNIGSSKLFGSSPGNIIYIVTYKEGIKNVRPKNFIYHDLYNEADEEK